MRYEDIELSEFEEKMVAVAWLKGMIPEEEKTQELCNEMVSMTGFAIEEVPEKYKTRELCLKAIENKGSLMRFAPEEFRRDPDFILEAVARDQNAYLYALDTDKLGKNFYVEVVHRNPLAIITVPEKYQSSEMRMGAVLTDGKALEGISSKFYDYELCKAAMDHGLEECHFVPVIKKDGKWYGHLPKNPIYEMAKAVVESHQQLEKEVKEKKQKSFHR